MNESVHQNTVYPQSPGLPQQAFELNLDGLVGPTHNYAGLAPGNLASEASRGRASNPRAAALQGLKKMQALMELGVPQGVLPPPMRPDLGLLRRLGFHGSESDLLQRSQRDAPHLLAAAWSASSMWAANAATICPSPDSIDGRLHLTPANLGSALHRANEAPATAALLQQIFPNRSFFSHHDPLPVTPALGDEGAANHTRLCAFPGQLGVQWWIFGRGQEIGARETVAAPNPRRFSARQTYAASQAVARLNRVDPLRSCFAQQHPDAIDAGVFHHDVASVGHRDTVLIHERALWQQSRALGKLRELFEQTTGRELRVIEVPEVELPLSTCVGTYLFNSQLVTPFDGSTRQAVATPPHLIAPSQCAEHAATADYLDSLTQSGRLAGVTFVDVRESMDNGGGPACLRLRVALSPDEAAAMHPGVWMTPTRLAALTQHINAHYPTAIRPSDLADPQMAEQCRQATLGVYRCLDLDPPID